MFIKNNMYVIEVIKNMLRVDLNFTLRVVGQRQKIWVNSPQFLLSLSIYAKHHFVTCVTLIIYWQKSNIHGRYTCLFSRYLISLWKS